MLHVYGPKVFSFFAVLFASIVLCSKQNCRAVMMWFEFTEMPGKYFMVPWLQTLTYFSKDEDFNDTNFTQTEFENHILFVNTPFKIIGDDI